LELTFGSGNFELGTDCSITFTFASALESPISDISGGLGWRFVHRLNVTQPLGVGSILIPLLPGIVTEVQVVTHVTNLFGNLNVV
jgi:hypothetical protein